MNAANMYIFFIFQLLLVICSHKSHKNTFRAESITDYFAHLNQTFMQVFIHLFSLYLSTIGTTSIILSAPDNEL